VSKIDGKECKKNAFNETWTNNLRKNNRNQREKLATQFAALFSKRASRVRAFGNVASIGLAHVQ